MNVKLHERQPALMYYIMRQHNEVRERGRAAARSSQSIKLHLRSSERANWQEACLSVCETL